MSLVAMESTMGWEKKAFAYELRDEFEKQLKTHLFSLASFSDETRAVLLEGILSSYDMALLTLNSGLTTGQRTQSLPLVSTLHEYSLSRDGSPQSENCDAAFKNCDAAIKENQNTTPKKRKLMPTWTDQVRVSSDNGFEGPIDDGHSWRKYGQKDILGAKYPRSYYRCTYRATQNCWATKQVQRSDDDPTVFEIIYRGKHNCNQNCSPKKQEPKLKKPSQPNSPQPQMRNNLLLNFKTNLTVDTKETEFVEAEPHFSFPNPSFGWFENKNQNCYPTFEGNYNFYLEDGQMDFNEIMSTNTSASNSPILDLDFSIDPVHLDTVFPFDNIPGFFN